MKKQSNAVAEALNTTWAILASAAAKRAVAQVEVGHLDNAQDTMGYVEVWLSKAGARATSWSYARPRT